METLVETVGDDLCTGEEEAIVEDRSSEWSRSRDALLAREATELRSRLLEVVRLRRNSGGAMKRGYDAMWEFPIEEGRVWSFRWSKVCTLIKDEDGWAGVRASVLMKSVRECSMPSGLS